MSKIRLDSVTKVYGGETLAVKDFDLTIEDGEFLTLVGPSGSGKSTLLRMIAGLEDITDGEIAIGETVVNYLPPRKRDIAMVFQSYALYPHLNVRENMAFGLKRSTKLSREEINRRVEEAAALMGIEELLDKKPKHLSGGQRQRVATGRAIVREPAVFLFDEPLSNLDAKLRKHMRTELQRLQQQLGTTTVYVTHDQEEAMTMSDRIAILNHGKLQQVGPPREVYDKPRNLFVAQFIGSPSMNTFGVEFIPEDSTGRFEGDVAFEIESDDLGFLSDVERTRCILGIRPEHIDVSLSPVENAIPVTVDIIEPVGAHDLLYFNLSEDRDDIMEDTDDEDAETQELKALIQPMSVPEEYQRNNERVYLTFDYDHLHVFDRESGVNIRYADEPDAEEMAASPAT